MVLADGFVQNLAVPVPISARTNHHVKAAGHPREGLAARRVAPSGHGQAAYLRAGNLRLVCITSAGRLGDVVPVFVGGVRRGNRNEEDGESECKSFHRSPLFVAARHRKRSSLSLDPKLKCTPDEFQNG